MISFIIVLIVFCGCVLSFYYLSHKLKNLEYRIKLMRIEVDGEFNVDGLKDSDKVFDILKDKVITHKKKRPKRKNQRGKFYTVNDNNLQYFYAEEMCQIVRVFLKEVEYSDFRGNIPFGMSKKILKHMNFLDRDYTKLYTDIANSFNSENCSIDIENKRMIFQYERSGLIFKMIFKIRAMREINGF